MGDKVFARLSEDRGAIEYVQMTCHSLFDAGESSLLLGLVCGITGTDLANPTSEPAAARLLLLWAGPLGLPQPVLARLEASLGSHHPSTIGPCWPSLLGDDLRLRTSLGLGPSADLDRALLRLVDNGLRGPCTVLKARAG